MSVFSQLDSLQRRVTALEKLVPGFATKAELHALGLQLAAQIAAVDAKSNQNKAAIADVSKLLDSARAELVDALEELKGTIDKILNDLYGSEVPKPGPVTIVVTSETDSGD